MPDRSAKSGWAKWWIAILLLAGLAFVIGHIAQLQRFVALARNAHPQWLFASLALQVTTYICVASGWNAVLGKADRTQPIHRLVPIAVSKLFADQAIPGAGIGGNILLVDKLTALGVPRPTAMAVLLVSIIGYYAAYAALALAMLFTLWLHREATPLLSGVVTSLLLVSVAIPSLALWLRHRGSQPLPPSIENIGPLRRLLAAVGEAPDSLVKDGRLIAKVISFNGLVFLLDAATLTACLLAVGEPLSPMSAFIALMIGSIAMTLAPVPLGLGSFEASCIPMLTMLGTEVEPAIASTLLLRGFTLWLPLLIGLFFIRRRRKHLE